MTTAYELLVLPVMQCAAAGSCPLANSCFRLLKQQAIDYHDPVEGQARFQSNTSQRTHRWR